MPLPNAACSLEAGVLSTALAWCPCEPQNSGYDVEESVEDRARHLLTSYQVVETSKALQARGCQRIALQFPDSLLPDSFFVSSALEEALRILGTTSNGTACPIVFILGDTSYGECCVDEVAAEHLDADIVVHYGNACLSPTRSLPVIYIFPSHAKRRPGKDPLGLAMKRVEETLAMAPEAQRLVVLFDVELHQMVERDKREIETWLQSATHDGKPVVFARTRSDVSSIVEPSGDTLEREAEDVRPAVSLSQIGASSSTIGASSCCDRMNRGSGPCASRNQSHGGDSQSGECEEGLPSGAGQANPQLVLCGPLMFPAATDDGLVGDSNGIDECLPGDQCDVESGTAFLWLTWRDAGEESVQMRNAALQYSAPRCAGFFSFRVCQMMGEDGVSEKVVERVDVGRLLARRFALVEKIRMSERVGIVAGTLGVSGNLAIIERCKRVVERAGRQWYMVMVGKPTATKLGNFAEMDVFVLVACPQNALVDSREHLRPVVTPFELEVALGGRDWFSSAYCADFAELLRLPPAEEGVGEAGGDEGGGEGFAGNETMQIAERAEWKVARAGAGGAAMFLKSREWQGLDAGHDADGIDVAELDTSAIQGRSGVAAGYEREGGGSA